jgi:DNA polymerase-3 subunit gamma/tau
MAYQVLARKYRPQRFADVVGQDHVTVTLTNALAQDRIAHGYIFSGHRGIGKTTIARILAMSLNCRNPIGSAARPTVEPCETCVNCCEISAASRSDVSEFENSHNFDVEEIDAATNRGIDDARLLTSKILTRPTNASKYKILILDEAHQITDAAWNALLKTLEEPPPWAIFMFCTTQPEDLPQTIRSRCQHFSFHAVKLADILGQLRSIAAAEGVIADESALALLAEAGDGSMRDALSIMDQAIASAPMSFTLDIAASADESTAQEVRTERGHPRLDAAQIRELMGSVPNAVFERIFESVNANNSAEVMTAANQLLDAGNSPAQLARQCVRYLRNALIARIAALSPEGESAEGIGSELLQISPDEQRRAARTAALFSEEELSRFLQVMLRTFDELGYRQEQRFHFELGLLKLVHLRRLLPIEEALSQLPVGTTPRPANKLGAPSMPGSHPGMGGKITTKPGAPSATKSGAPFMPESHPGMSGKSPSTPAFSPFEQDKLRRRREGTASAVSAPIPISAGAPSMPESHPGMSGLPSLGVAPDPQHAVVQALIAASQTSAAEALADAVWTLANNEARIQTELSKTMLPVVINPDAERIARAVLRDAGVLKLTLLPAVATAVAKKPRPARTGSVQAKALEHPMVQQAQKLFAAEIQTVIDLREPD